jgi:hypothetical protein
MRRSLATLTRTLALLAAGVIAAGCGHVPKHARPGAGGAYTSPLLWLWIAAAVVGIVAVSMLVPLIPSRHARQPRHR